MRSEGYCSWVCLCVCVLDMGYLDEKEGGITKEMVGKILGGFVSVIVCRYPDGIKKRIVHV